MDNRPKNNMNASASKGQAALLLYGAPRQRHYSPRLTPAHPTAPRRSRCITTRSFTGLEHAAGQVAHLASSSASLPPDMGHHLHITSMSVDSIISAIKEGLAHGPASELAHTLSSHVSSSILHHHQDYSSLLGDSHIYHAPAAPVAPVPDLLHSGMAMTNSDMMSMSNPGHEAISDINAMHPANNATADSFQATAATAAGDPSDAAAAYTGSMRNPIPSTTATAAAAVEALHQAAAILQPSLSSLDSQAATLKALAAFTSSKLAAVASSSGSHELLHSLNSSVNELVRSVGDAMADNAAGQLQGSLNSLLVEVQQLLGGLKQQAADTAEAAEAAGSAVAAAAGGASANSGSSSSIAAMAAAQEALQDAEAAALAGATPLAGIIKVSLVLLALLAAAVPRSMHPPPAPNAPGSTTSQAGKSGTTSSATSSTATSSSSSSANAGDEIPLVYDPEALTAYFNKRPLQCVAILESLGPAYIKIGQAMSTRVDMVPEPYITQLVRLQESVPVFSNEQALAVLQEGLGAPINQVFAWLSDEPVAAASLGQVYKGQLLPQHGGGSVAVKVQRPGVLEAAALDIFVMRRAAFIFSKLPGMDASWSGVLDEWALLFFGELDYTTEAYNTMAFKRHMTRLEGISVAHVYPSLTSRKVLVMSWVEGQKLAAVAAATPGMLPGLCSSLLNCYLVQLLETGLLHADPHPGNLLVTREGRLVILDFGLMTEVTEAQRIALVEFITHLTMEDWSGVVGDMVTLGFLPHGLPEGAGEETMAGLMQQIMGQLVKGGGLCNGINVFSLTHELEAVAKSYKVVVPPYFTLVLRAFSTIEGIALKVDPSYSIVAECLPYLSRRLLSDNNPHMRAALRHLLYGNGKRVDLVRLQRMMAAAGAFTTQARASQPVETTDSSNKTAGLPGQVLTVDTAAAGTSLVTTGDHTQQQQGVAVQHQQHQQTPANNGIQGSNGHNSSEGAHSSSATAAAAAAGRYGTSHGSTAPTPAAPTAAAAAGSYGASGGSNAPTPAAPTAAAAAAAAAASSVAAAGPTAATAASNVAAAGLGLIGSMLGALLAGRAADAAAGPAAAATGGPAAAAAALGFASLLYPLQHSVVSPGCCDDHDCMP